MVFLENPETISQMVVNKSDGTHGRIRETSPKQSWNSDNSAGHFPISKARWLLKEFAWEFELHIWGNTHQN